MPKTSTSPPKRALDGLRWIVFLRSLTDEQSAGMRAMLDALLENKPNPEFEGLSFLESLTQPQLEEVNILMKDAQWARIH